METTPIYGRRSPGRRRWTHAWTPCFLVAAVLSGLPAALDAKAGRCRPEAPPEDYEAEWDRIYTQTEDEWTDTDRIVPLSRRQRLTSLSSGVTIYGTEEAAPIARIILDMMGRVDAELRQLGATGAAPREIGIVLYDAVEPYVEPDGDSTPAWFGCEDGVPRCWVSILRSGWELAEIKVRHMVAHEFFHVAQRIAVPGVDNCKNAWWTEGTAEWFANRMVPGSEWSKGFLRRFDQASGTTSLTHLAYEAQAFFYWAGEHFDATYPLALGRRGDSVLKNAARVAATLPAEEWQDFLETYLRGELRYPDGRPAIPDPYLGEVLPTPGELEAPTLAFARAQFEIEPGEGELTVDGNTQYAALRKDSDWSRLDLGPAELEMDTDCPGPDHVVVGAVGTGESGLTVTLEGERDEIACRCEKPPPADHCMVGTWQAVSTDAPSRFNRHSTNVGGPSRWVGQDMGESLFAFRPDGRFGQHVQRETTSNFRHRMGGSTEMDQKVTITNRALGRWSVPAEGKLEICKEEFEGKMVNTVSVGGRRQSTGPMPIPYDPAEEERGADYTYRCNGNRVTVTLLLDGRPFVSWEAQRVGDDRFPLSPP